MAARNGLDYRPLLKKVGYTHALLNNPDKWIALRPAIRLVEESARRSNCPSFGLQMALERTISDMGMVSVLLALQPSVKAALGILDSYRSVIVPSAAINKEIHEDVAVISLDIALGSPEPHHQVNDLLLGCAVIIIRSILGQDWVPLCVHFMQPRPAPEHLASYHRMFGARLEFNAELYGLSIKRADLTKERQGQFGPLARHAEALVNRAMTPAGPNISQTVRQSIMHMIGSSQCTLESTAAALHLNPRTLQRRLESEGYTYRQLTALAREQLAVRMLSNPSSKVADVAEALGYSSTGAFSRWHRRTFGKPPTLNR